MANPVTVTAELETCTGHRLLHYVGKCANLHGHNYRWIVSVTSYVRDRNRGYELDFGALKATLQKELEPLDHAMLLNYLDPIVPALLSAREHKTVLMNCNPTAENLAQWLADLLFAEMYQGSTSVEVELWETSKCRVRASGELGGTITLTEQS